MQTATRIAMWSGPRNISTAMMRSWENRSDVYVCDEPLYAHYLEQTGHGHPGRDETIQIHETDWKMVVDWLTGPIPDGRTVWYQKQMAHHLLPNIEREWINELVNCFLIRDPREMLTSLVEFIPEPTVEDTGLPQQVELFEQVKTNTGSVPLVIDCKDVLGNPKGMLEAICARLGLEFSESMMNWPEGLRETDGAWAPHWYDKVKITTGFGDYRPKDDEVPGHLNEVYDQCVEYYNRLAPHRLQI